MSQKALNSHYAALLGLDKDWKVDEVKLDLAGSKVEIALAFTGKKATCSECGNNCSTKDHSPERQWRHLDTMNFETVLKTRVPRANCSACGVKVMTVLWAGKHGRFTLMFEAFAIAVLEAASSTEAARHLLGLSWDSLQGIMDRTVDQVRRAEHKVLIAEGRSDLTGSRYNWLKSEENRTKKQQNILENLCGENLKTSRAWAIKESFNEFWNSRNEDFAEGVFLDWYGWAIRSHLPDQKGCENDQEAPVWINALL